MSEPANPDLPAERHGATTLVALVVILLGILAATTVWSATRGADDASAPVADAAEPAATAPPGTAPCGFDVAPPDPDAARPPSVPADPLGRPLVTVTGRVVEGRCLAPVPSLVVWVYPEGDDTRVVGGAATDGDGMFAVQLPAGRYRFGVHDASKQDPYTFVWYKDLPDAAGAMVVEVTAERRLEDVVVHRAADHPVPDYRGGGRRIAVVGDSLVQQSATSIYNALRPYGAVSVVGIADQRIDQMRPVVERFAATRPEVAVIALGNNDVLQGRPPSGSATALAELIGAFDEGTCVLVLDVSARTADPTFNERASALGATMRETVGRHGSARLLDWNAVAGNLLATDPDSRAWFTDGLHLQPAGMMWFALTMAGGLERC